MKRFVFYLVICLTGLGLSVGLAAGQALEIVRITPSGDDVPPGRQIVIQFDRPVVPLGRMERDPSEIPIRIQPALDGQWRWLNPGTLALQLSGKNALKAATRYRIRVTAGLRALDGTTLERDIIHTFITQRPKVRFTWLKTWLGPGVPVLRLTFDQPVSRQSVGRHVFLRLAEQLSGRIGVDVEADPQDNSQPLALSDPPDQARRIWLIQPQTELPADRAVELTITPGLVSALGPEPGIEDRVLVGFHTFPAFAFLGVSCTDNKGQPVFVSPGDMPGEHPACNPLRAVALVFNTPVFDEAVKTHMRISPDLSGGRGDYDPWAGRRNYSRLYGLHRKDSRYRVWLPEILQAFETYSISSKPGLKDEFGRSLAQPLDMLFDTDHRPPDFKLTHPVAVLEKDVDSHMPLVVTNLDAVELIYERLTVNGVDRDRKTRIRAPEAQDVAVRIPLPMRGLLGGKTGLIRGTVSSVPAVVKDDWQRRFFVQVTPFHVHVKIGHFNTLVWVTDLKTGEPVRNARVSILPGAAQAFPAGTESLGDAVTAGNGVAMLEGTRRLDPKLERFGYGQPNPARLFVRVIKNDDIALLPLVYDYAIDTYRVSNYTVSSRMRPRFGHIHTWGTTAQGVYRAGDLIQYKLYVRDQSNATLIKAPREGYRLKVIDPLGKTVHEITRLTLARFGAYDGQFRVPANAAVGWYRFELSAEFYPETWQPMRVLVSDFTPAAFRVSTTLNGPRFLAGQTMRVETSASLHAGGPYVDAAARVTATLRAVPLRPEHPAANGFQFDTRPADKPDRLSLHQSEGQLNQDGIMNTSFDLAQSHILFGRLTVESAVRDDRGKSIAGAATADYLGRDRFVGLRSTRWVLKEGQPAKMDVLVVDAAGAPAAGTPVKVIIERRQTRAARVKGAGNAYVTRFSHEWLETGTSELTSGNGPVVCRFTPPAPGSYRVTAEITDTAGRTHSTRLFQWALGKGRVLWEESADNRLEIVAEKKEARVGERMRFLVKNPFPGARALVSIERYGVLRSWVQRFDTSTPVIVFDVEKNYIPGFYLSVLVMSPRAGDPPAEGGPDLGKPAFRMGYAAVRVPDAAKQIAIDVTPDRSHYKPGETVQVTLQTTLPGSKAVEPVEMAVAVLDEAVFDLIARGRDNFDPYKGFYTLDGLDLDNYSLLLRLVGRQKFEKKGANPGGGGGKDIGLRSVFKFVSYWNPSLVTDDLGQATIAFEAPDNLTGWRVLAMAVTPTDRMGLGEGTFTVNRPTEIRPVMPNRVIEGDRFRAGFSIMNRTDRPRRLTVDLSAAGVVKPGPGDSDRKTTHRLTLEPYQRRTVWLPLETTGEGTVRFTARAGDDVDRDGVTHTLAVARRYTLETAATYATADAGQAWEQFEIPSNIRTDVGRLRVVVAPSVIANLEGAFSYLKAYPYTCWEQLLTRAVMAGQYERLRGYLPYGFIWEGSDLLPMQTLERAAAFQTPNGGMAYYIPEARFADPYLSAYSALAFSWLQDIGYDVSAAVKQKLRTYLQSLLRHDLWPEWYTAGMQATVRAVALAALAGSGDIGQDELLRHRSYLPQMSLFGKAHFLLAAMRMDGSEALRRSTADMVLSHADETGGKLVFTESLDAQYARLLSSDLRTQGAVLAALTAYAQTAPGRRHVGDLPFKLVRTLTQNRGSRSHWESTQANSFCMNGLIDYSRVYEPQKPDMKLIAKLDARPIGTARFSGQRFEPQTFERPFRASDPGRRATVTIERQGKGRFYYGARLDYAPLSVATEPINAGIDLRREYSVERNGRRVVLPSPVQIERGELVQIDLFVSLPAARHFVVVNDPVPGGLEPVNRELATASTVDAEAGQLSVAEGSYRNRFDDWQLFGSSRSGFYHRELRLDSARFYSEYLPAGNYLLSYTAQAIAPGQFSILPARAEEMYEPDVQGKSAWARLEVRLEK